MSEEPINLAMFVNEAIVQAGYRVREEYGVGVPEVVAYDAEIKSTIFHVVEHGHEKLIEVRVRIRKA